MTDGDPSANYGQAPVLWSGFGMGQNEPFISRLLLYFDLAFIPRESQIQSATFEMLLTQADGPSPIVLSLHELLAGWDESKVTWADQPPAAPDFFIREETGGSAPAVVSWDVREFVQQRVDDPHINQGFLVRGPEEGPFWRRVFESRHHTSFCPRLNIAVIPQGSMDTPTPTATPTGAPQCPYPDTGGGSFADATPLLPDGTLYQERLCPSGDVDWWKFPLKWGQEVTISLFEMPRGPDADYDLFLLAPTGGLLASSARLGADKDEFICYTALVDGDYRVLVKGKGPADWHPTKTYSLRVRAQFMCEEDQAEDHFWNPTRIEPSFPQANIRRVYSDAICPAGDVDVYDFLVPGGQIITVTVRLTSLMADYRLLVQHDHHPTVKIYESDNPGLADEMITATVYQANSGYWLVEVRGSQPFEHHIYPYQLEVMLEGEADLKVTDIEVTQGIQNLKNTTSLVIGKATSARVYVSIGPVPVPLTDVVVELLGWHKIGGSFVPLSSVLVSSPQDVHNLTWFDHYRAQSQHNFNFLLPTDWMNGKPLLLEAQVNPGPIVPEEFHANNSLQVGPLSPFKVNPLHLAIIPIEAGGLSVSLTNNPDFNTMVTRFKALFPVSTLTLYPAKTPLTTDYDYAKEGKGCGPGWKSLLDDLEDAYDAWSKRPPRAFVYGLLHPSVPRGGVAGCGRMPGHAAAGVLDLSAGTTLAHELGHNLGRKHAPSDRDEQQ